MEFTDPSFDPVEYVNNVLSPYSDESNLTSLEECISDLVSQLRSRASDAQRALESASQIVSRRLQRVEVDIERSKREVENLISAAETVSKNHSDEREELCTNRASSLDTTLRRMGEAEQLLVGASLVAKDMAQVEATFDSSDFEEISEHLESLQKGLSSLTEYEEFDDMRRKAAKFTERLEKILVPTLIEALAARQLDTAKSLMAIFRKIDKNENVFQIYVGERKGAIIDMWTKLFGEKEEDWPLAQTALSQFFNEILAFLSQEVVWCKQIFTKTANPLSDLMRTILKEMNPSISSVLHSLFRKEDALVAMDYLKDCFNEMRSFVVSLKSVVKPAVETESLDIISKVVLSDFVSFIDQYTAKEREILLSMVGKIDITSDSFSEKVRQIVVSKGPLFAQMELALGRCDQITSFSAGFLAVSTISEVSQSYLDRMKKIIEVLRVDVGQSSILNEGDSATEGRRDQSSRSSFLHGSVEVYSVILEIEERIGSLDSIARELILKFGEDFVDKDSGVFLEEKDEFVSCYLRGSGKWEKWKSLDGYLRMLMDEGGSLLQNAKDKHRSVVALSAAFVLDTAFASVRDQMQTIPSLPSWRKPTEQDPFKMPVFSVHPSDHITAVGEYLFSIPEQLESISTEEGRTLLEEIARLAEEEYIRQISRIPTLSSIGRQQLREDTAYLRNVLLHLTHTSFNRLADMSLILEADTDEQFEAACSNLSALQLEEAHSIGKKFEKRSE